MQNTVIESFDGRLRDECLNKHLFANLAAARRIIEAWRIDYNTRQLDTSFGGLTPTEFAARLHRGHNHNRLYPLSEVIPEQVKMRIQLPPAVISPSAQAFYTCLPFSVRSLTAQLAIATSICVSPKWQKPLPTIGSNCGQVGKQDNCQVAVSLSLANRHASLPMAWRLYLPKEWAADEERRRKAGVPEEVDFATKPQIALEQLREAYAAGCGAALC
jgi:hypothetical protein